jgi:hypothetical protein
VVFSLGSFGKRLRAGVSGSGSGEAQKERGWPKPFAWVVVTSAAASVSVGGLGACGHAGDIFDIAAVPCLDPSYVRGVGQ